MKLKMGGCLPSSLGSQSCAVMIQCLRPPLQICRDLTTADAAGYLFPAGCMKSLQP